MGSVKDFTYPAEWGDDQIMNVMFSPFRQNRHVNPQSWDSKLKFWSDLITSHCKFTGSVIITPNDLPYFFQRKGKLPQCINKVLEENHRMKKLIPVTEFTSVAQNTWLGWGVNWMVKKPAAWTLNTFVKQPILWTYSKVVGNNPETPHSLPQVVLKELVCELSREVFSRQQSQVIHETTDCIVGFDILFQRNKDLFKDQENFHMALLQLVKDKQCVLFETEKHHKVVRFVKSNKRSITPPNDCDSKIYKLKVAETTLQEQVLNLETETHKLQEEAKSHLRSGSKAMAKNSLRRKRRVEVLRTQKETALSNIQQLITVIQQADSNKMVLDAYSSGNEVFKHMSKEYGLTPEKVDDIMTDMEQTFEMQDDLNQSLVLNPTVGDDMSMAELEDELTQILSANEETDDKRQPDFDYLFDDVTEDTEFHLPEVPTFDPASPVSGHNKSRWDTSRDKPSSTWS